MNHSLTGLFLGHSKFTRTDQLYDPLRQTLMQDTTSKKTQLLQASQHSRVTHSIKTHTLQQNLQIAEHTLIQQNVKLHATHNIWKLPKDAHYCIINAQQKIYQPISEEQMKRILENGAHQEVIVYTIEDQEQQQRQQDIYRGFQSRFQHSRVPNNSKVFDDDKNNTFAYSSSNMDKMLNKTALYSGIYDTSKINKFTAVQQNTRDTTARDFVTNMPQQNIAKVEENASVDSQKSKGRLRLLYSKKGSGIMVTQPKYNFFSALDEPINNFFNGKNCTCPANQIVAGPKNEVSWYGTIAR